MQMVGRKVSVVLLLVIALAMSMAVVAFQARTAVAADDSETELETHMDGIDKAYKALKKQVADPSKNAESLKLVVKMEQEAIIAKTLIPAKEADEKDKAAFQTAFRSAMCDFCVEILNLEKALVNNKNDEAAAIVKKLNEMKTSGHKQFQKDE